MWKGTGCFECSMPLIWEPVSFNVFKAINHLRINNVWIGRGYSFGETFFYYHSVGIINKDFENILISLFKMWNRELLEEGIYRIGPKRIISCISLVQPSLAYEDYGIKGGRWGANVEFGCERIFKGHKSIFLDFTVPNYDICNFFRVGIPSTYL